MPESLYHPDDTPRPEPIIQELHRFADRGSAAQSSDDQARCDLGIALSEHDRENFDDLLDPKRTTHFSAHLVRLIAKGDYIQRRTLGLIYPDHLEAYDNWMARDDPGPPPDPCPPTESKRIGTARELSKWAKEAELRISDGVTVTAMIGTLLTLDARMQDLVDPIRWVRSDTPGDLVEIAYILHLMVGRLSTHAPKKHTDARPPDDKANDLHPR